MESNKILNADILDIIFEGRNKEYGAYQLRKTYNRRLLIALAAMAGIILFIFLAYLISNAMGSDKDNKKLVVQDVQLQK
jgi:protein TonB